MNRGRCCRKLETRNSHSPDPRPPTPGYAVGLIGDPVAHSVSPAIHDSAFAARGLPQRYGLWPTPADELAERVASLRAPNILGANVTIPHKSAVLPLLDEVDPLAEAVGAANTIVRLPDGRLRGLNTDVGGFGRALASDGYDPSGKVAVLLGAGGAARAVAYALLRAGASGLVIANRTLERAETLLGELVASIQGEPFLRALAPDDPELATELRSAALLVNATSVGLHGEELPLQASLLAPHLLVVDLIYRRTPLLAAAERCGARTQDGLEMLVQQGALAWEAWTGLQAPVDVMREAARRALAERR